MTQAILTLPGVTGMEHEEPVTKEEFHGRLRDFSLRHSCGASVTYDEQADMTAWWVRDIQFGCSRGRVGTNSTYFITHSQG